MNEPGRPEDTNSINFLLKVRYVKLRLDLNGGNNWLSKLLEPEDMNAFADWKTPPEGKRVLIRNKENLPLKTIDNLIILYEVFGLKPANLKKILLGDKAGLDALRAEMSRRKTLVPFQVAMTQRGEWVLDQLGTSGASLQDVDIEEVLFMSPTGAGEARFASISQLAALRTLEIALESERPSAVWEAIDGYIRLGELDAAEAMLDEYAPEKTAPEEESSEEGVARIHALLATEPKEADSMINPDTPVEAVVLRAALAGLRMRQADAKAQAALFWRDNLAEPLSAEESAYDERANDEMNRAVKNLEDAVNRSFIILAAAQREGFWDTSSRLSNLRSASQVLKGAKKRLLSHFGWLSAHDSRKEHWKNMEYFSRIPKSEELRQVLVTLARDTLYDFGDADSDRFDALCILRRLSPETLKEYDSEVEGTIRRRHAYNERTSPFTDDGTLVLVDDLEAWWVKTEAEWRDTAEQRLRSTRRDLARELILRFQDTEGPQAAITELNRLAELGWIDVRHDDGSPSLEFTILAKNWVNAKSGSEPPAEIKEAASDRRNTDIIFDEDYCLPDAVLNMLAENH